MCVVCGVWCEVFEGCLCCWHMLLPVVVVVNIQIPQLTAHQNGVVSYILMRIFVVDSSF